MEQTKKSEHAAFIFQEALQTFVEKLKRDDQVIAAVLYGSLSYDTVWEKSDIDLKLIVQDQKLKKGYMCFVENDVPINASIQTRNEFKRWMERSVQSSIEHSMLIRSTLLFTKDPSIEPYFEQIRYVGERDRQLQLLRLGCHTLGMAAKAEKWLYVKRDAAYSAYWIIRMVDLLAQIEVVTNGEVPMRESIQQALAMNPPFFRDIYTEMVCGEVDERKAAAALQRINGYLDERAEQLFQPILAFLKEEADVRTVTDIAEKLGSVIHLDTGSITTACDWLAERGYLAKMEAETKATPKSRIELCEPAYMYENLDDLEWEMQRSDETVY
jgi:predicted nucleotidyltransferase